ncbi:hypothetical protein H4R20_002250 [Coemansia guatemalensis]|uniref:Uncharacterized protein n=1 Tax=Coemansia guatemalensis TaxID=2761395 RepID=A0A9W8HVT5_9FUNG|nr:hypothetical protein H4R20_002250 [Coemansia guatemalensis]
MCDSGKSKNDSKPEAQTPSAAAGVHRETATAAAQPKQGEATEDITEEERKQFEALKGAGNKPPDEVVKANFAAKFNGKVFVELAANSARKVNPATEFTVNDLPSTHRILRGPNPSMTTDYRPDRLNIYLDDKNVCYGARYDGQKTNV